jgi:hypothetical protein
MTPAEVIMFIGFLDKLCTNQNSMLHYYVDKETAEAEASATRDTEIQEGPEVEN